MRLKDFPELRILAILGIITLGWHLLSTFGSFLGIFADIFLLLILSWILSFILEPVVAKIVKTGPSRILSAVIVYLVLAIVGTIIIWVVLPTTVAQLTQLAGLIPGYLPTNSIIFTKVADFLASTASSSLSFASSLASMATGLLLVFIMSFYLLVSRFEISKFLLDIIPDRYEEDFKFLEKTIDDSFASFLQIQVVLGLAIGLATLIVLLILNVNFVLSTSLLAAILAMVPVVGSVLFLIPVALACLTVSLQKLLIAVTILIILAQFIYNLWAPKLLGDTLKIHPIIVLLSFLIGFKIGGVWGAIFAVPVTSALAIVSQELLKYWRQEADK